MDGSGHLTDKMKSEKFVHGIKTLFDYRFAYHTPEKNAHLLGRAIVEGKCFGPKAGLEVASSMARAYTHNVFTSKAILKAIDTKCQGALNADGGVRDYAQIENLMGPVKAKRGHTLLPDRNRILLQNS